MLSRVTVNIIKRSVCNNARMLCRPRDPLKSDLSSANSSTKPYTVQNHSNLYIAKRFKSSKKKTATIKKNQDSDKESDDEDEEEVPVGSKVTKIKVGSIRFDNIAKGGFKMSRSKIEEAFYESKFRINGNKVLKKSRQISIGDEIDMILHQSMDNPGLLVINRIVILSMEPATEGAEIKLSIDKNLLIEDYEDPYI